MSRTAGFLGVAVALTMGASLAAPAAAPEQLGVSTAEASHGCTPVAEIYGSSRGWYATAGVRCHSTQSRIAISGKLWGSGRFFEFSKKCKKRRICFEDTPMYRGDQPGDVIKIAIAAGTKRRWYSVPPKYVGRRREFRLPAPSDRPG